MLKEFNITLDVKKELISNKITGLNLNDLATIKIKFVQNSLPYDINNKDIRIDYRLPDGVLLFQNQNTGVTKIDGNTIDIQVINQALQQVGDVTLDISIFFKDTSKKITTSKLILKVDSIIYKEEQLSTDFDALQTALNDSKKLESKFGTAKDLDNKLQQDFKTGNALDNTLKEDIKNADTSKSNLDTTISTANTANNNLKNTINKADTTTYATRGEVKTLTTQYEDMANTIRGNGQKLYLESKKEWQEETLEIANFAGQGEPQAKIPIGFVYHNYTDGIMAQLDNVGDKNNILILKNANNQYRRSDKPKDFIGTGDYLLCLKHNPEPNSTSFKMFQIDKDGNFYWFDKQDTVHLGTNKTDDNTYAFTMEVFKKHKKIFSINNGYTQVFNLAETNGNLLLNSTGALDLKILSAGGNTIIDANKDIYIQKIPLLFDGVNYAKPLRNLSGDSNCRPLNVCIGDQYFDTRLGKPVWWNGTKWIDAIGNEV